MVHVCLVHFTVMFALLCALCMCSMSIEP